MAIGAYFLSALTTVIDKFLLKRAIPSALVYGFYMGILSIFALPLIIFDLSFPGFSGLILDLFCGFVFLLASIVLFEALRRGQASSVAPVVGAFGPLVIFSLNLFIYKGGFDVSQVIACAFLVLGSVLVSGKHNSGEKNKKSRLKFFGFSKSFWLAVLAGFLFGGFYVMIDHVYASQSFISAFVFFRLGSFLAALALVFWSGNRELIFKNASAIKRPAAGLFVLNKVIAGVAFIFLNWAIYLTGALVVNSLQGAQYVFLFGFMLVVSGFFPKILKEKLDARMVALKSAGIVLIATGIASLFGLMK